MRPEEMRAIREIVGYSQRALAEELGVSEKAVKLWERGLRGVPDDVADWLLGALADHDAIVDAALDKVAAEAEERGEPPEVVTLSYWRTQAELDETGEVADYGVINARTREIAQTLRREGFEVGFRND